MKHLFLGDIHGDWRILSRALNRYKDVPDWGRLFQVGDFGLGFRPVLNLATGQMFDNDPQQFDDRIRFIRGNHDNPAACARYPNYLGDYGIDPETGIFFLGGAWSIDHKQRTVGIDWWEDEELSYETLQHAIDLYLRTRPTVVLTHTCPSPLARYFARKTFYHGSRTESALEMMFRAHQPKLWVFGHWHTMWDKETQGTRFVCLSINQTKLIDLPT